MEISPEEIKALAREVLPRIQGIREQLHQYPEPSFREFETSRFLSSTLKDWMGLSAETLAETGLVLCIPGRNPTSRTIALRADIDALPISERSDVPYRSRNEGFMHACGHDVHAACLLGAVWILHKVRDRFEGTVKIIFQPGEELLPGGASKMIAGGVLENPDVQAIFGQHVSPELPVGTVGFRSGQSMASCDELYLTVTGKGGHGAMPHRGADPILISAHLITALQQIVSRTVNPIVPAVLTLGSIRSLGGATNIIPDQVLLEGTFRTLDDQERAAAREKIQKLAFSLVEGMGGSLDFRWESGYPSLLNDPALTECARTAAEVFLGAAQVVDLPVRLTAEDFSNYSRLVPACFYRLGTAHSDGRFSHPVHTPWFDVDPKSLEIGAGLFAWIALQQMEEKSC